MGKLLWNAHEEEWVMMAPDIPISDTSPRWNAYVESASRGELYEEDVRNLRLPGDENVPPLP